MIHVFRVLNEEDALALAQILWLDDIGLPDSLILLFG